MLKQIQGILQKHNQKWYTHVYVNALNVLHLKREGTLITRNGPCKYATHLHKSYVFKLEKAAHTPTALRMSNKQKANATIVVQTFVNHRVTGSPHGSG